MPLPININDLLHGKAVEWERLAVIKHHDRAEATRVENFPYPAIEEAVVNAIYHRSYDVREPVEVRISRKELVVLSYPSPDRSVRLEQLRAGKAMPRRYRNRRIGEFLKELEFTEGRSTGIPKINRVMRENGSPPAEFEFDEDHSYFTVRLRVQPDAPQVTGQVTGQVKEQVLTLLRACVSPQKSSDLQTLIGLKHRETFQRNYLDPLLAKGWITRTIPDKPKSRMQRYLTTAAGKHQVDHPEVQQ